MAHGTFKASRGKYSRDDARELRAIRAAKRDVQERDRQLIAMIEEDDRDDDTDVLYESSEFSMDGTIRSSALT